MDIYVWMVGYIWIYLDANLLICKDGFGINVYDIVMYSYGYGFM